MKFRTEAEQRYVDDPEFHQAVLMVEALAERNGFTPYELKQVAFLAALHVEMRRPPAPFGLRQLEALRALEENR